MKKEIIISFVILFFIIVFHAITQVYTQNFFDSISDNLNSIEEIIFSEDINRNELENDIDNIINKWKENYDYYACFIEHDELEKVQTQLISIKSNIKTEDYGKAIDETERCKFILKHIEEKDSLKIVNIF